MNVKEQVIYYSWCDAVFSFVYVVLGWAPLYIPEKKKVSLISVWLSYWHGCNHRTVFLKATLRLQSSKLCITIHLLDTRSFCYSGAVFIIYFRKSRNVSKIHLHLTGIAGGREGAITPSIAHMHTHSWVCLLDSYLCFSLGQIHF